MRKVDTIDVSAPADDDEILDPGIPPMQFNSRDVDARPAERLRPMGRLLRGGERERLAATGTSSTSTDVELGLARAGAGGAVGDGASAAWAPRLDSSEGRRAAWALVAEFTGLEVCEGLTAERCAQAFESTLYRSYVSAGFDNLDETANARGWNWAQKKLMASAKPRVSILGVRGTVLMLTFKLGPISKTLEYDCAGGVTSVETPWRAVASLSGMQVDERGIVQVSYCFASAKARAACQDCLIKMVSQIEFSEDRKSFQWKEWTLQPSATGRPPVLSTQEFHEI